MANIRPAIPEDFAFVMDSWLNSWRKSPWAGTIRNDEYFKVQRSTIEGLIGRGAEVLVATSESGRILGWVCYEVVSDRAAIHYLYVKDAFIPLGIGALLVDRIPGTKPGFYSHRYRQVIDLCRGWTHAPEIARRKA